MHTAVIRSAQSLGIANDRMPSPWGSRLRSILSSRRDRKNEESKDDSLYRLTTGFSPPSDCTESTEFPVRKIELSTQVDRRYRLPC